MVQVPHEVIGPATLAMIKLAGGTGRHVLGYIDPGTGSLIIQAGIAAALSVPFILRSKIRALASRVARRRDGARENSEPIKNALS